MAPSVDSLVYVFDQLFEAAAWEALIAAAPNPDTDPRRNSEPEIPGYEHGRSRKRGTS